MALPVRESRTSYRNDRKQGQLAEILSASFTMRQYIMATFLSILFWLFMGITSNNTIVAVLGAFIIGAVVMLSPLLFARRHTVAALTVMAYLAAVQPAIRTYIPALRYNILEYTIPLSVFFILTQQRKFVLGIPTFFYLLYLGLELIGMINAELWVFVRGVFLSSFTLLLTVLIAEQIKIPVEQMTHVWRGYLVGALSILILLARILFSETTLTWTTESNTQFTAGMGPNQISLILSIAVFFALVLGDQTAWRWRWIYQLLAGIFAYFMILTFSRGGLYILTGAVLLYYFFFQRPQGKTWFVLIVFGCLLYAVLSIATDTTQGILLKRYSDIDTTHRADLAQHGWQIFLNNPIFGVGTANYYAVVSQSNYFGAFSGAHNEFIRAAAEHGIFGLVFWSLFAFSSLVVAIAGQGGRLRALRLALLFIAFVSMFYNGLKLVIQPLLIFMSFTLTSESITQLTQKEASEKNARSVPKSFSRVSPRATRKSVYSTSNRENTVHVLRHDKQ